MKILLVAAFLLSPCAPLRAQSPAGKDPKRAAVADLWDHAMDIHNHEAELDFQTRERQSALTELTEMGGSWNYQPDEEKEKSLAEPAIKDDRSPRIRELKEFLWRTEGRITQEKARIDKAQERLEKQAKQAVETTRPEGMPLDAWREFVGTPEDAENPRGITESWPLHLARQIRRYEAGLGPDGKPK